MDLSIIIVNWNSKNFLAKALASVQAGVRDIEYEVVVIDSGSFDGCGDMLRSAYPDVTFIQSERNLGFARANNEAFRRTRGHTLLFLNPDTEVVGDGVVDLYHVLQRLPDAAIIGPRLLNTDGSIQDTCIRAFPTLLNQLVDSDLLRSWFPRSVLWGKRHLCSAGDAPKLVDAVCGACLMMRREQFEAVGLFSTDYFMYAEDIELCLKAAHAGRRTYYLPTAVVIHHGGGSSAQTPVSTFSAVMRVESQWRFFRKTRSPVYAALYRTGMFVASIVRIAALTAMIPLPRGKEGVVRGSNALRKWNSRLRWSVGGERWVRDH